MPLKRSAGASLRNPLAVFGLILLAGDGPLVVAYGLSRGTSVEWLFAISSILFVFGMGAFFCYIVLRHPRHLFAPHEIPLGTIGKSIFNDSDCTLGKAVDEIQKKIETRTNAQIQKLVHTVSGKFTELMQSVAVKGVVIEQTRPEVDSLIGSLVMEARRLDAEGKKAEESVRRVYQSALHSMKTVFSSIRSGTEDRELPGELREVTRTLMLSASRLQMEFGDSADVIAGANNISVLASTDDARAALSAGLRRQDISNEARETLLSRVRELETHA